MGYKKDMSKYEYLKGWRDVVLENSLISGRKNMEKNCGHGQRRGDQLYGIKAKSRLSCGSFSA